MSNKEQSITIYIYTKELLCTTTTIELLYYSRTILLADYTYYKSSSTFSSLIDF